MVQQKYVTSLPCLNEDLTAKCSIGALKTLGREWQSQRRTSKESKFAPTNQTGACAVLKHEFLKG